mmetsp:Transcript_47252/g.137523  ORF Transcript_47252/g.137523 Transcript_47252/m.137523 type:complete len:253 (+) Transcript_47252:544-1302(+)
MGLLLFQKQQIPGMPVRIQNAHVQQRQRLCDLLPNESIGLGHVARHCEVLDETNYVGHESLDRALQGSPADLDAGPGGDGHARARIAQAIHEVHRLLPDVALSGRHALPREVLALSRLEDSNFLAANLKGVDGTRLPGVQANGSQAVLMHTLHEVLPALPRDALNAHRVHSPQRQAILGVVERLLGERSDGAHVRRIAVRPVSILSRHLGDFQGPATDLHGAEDAGTWPVTSQRRCPADAVLGVALYLVLRD